MEIEDDKNDKINKDEMKDIIQYINQLDYDRYEKDLEIREALQLLKNKMDKEKEELKAVNSLESINNNETVEVLPTISVKEPKIEEEIIEIIKPEEKIEIKELTEEEKDILENNWNSSTKINPTDTTQENIEVKKNIEKIYKKEKKKLAIHSYQSFQKLFARQGYDSHSYYPNRLQISVQNDRDPVVKNTHARFPFLLSQPYI